MTEQLQSDFDKTIRNLDISDKEIKFKKSSLNKIYWEWLS